MKAILLLPSLIFLNLFLLIPVCKAQISSNNVAQGVNKKIAESAKGTKIDSSVKAAALWRDSIAAEILINKILQEKKQKEPNPELSIREISSILSLDNDRAELHFKLAKLYFADFKEDQQKKYEDLALRKLDDTWQELEWFKLQGIETNFKDSLTAIRQNIPPRPSQDVLLTNEIMAEARKTFQTGKGIYIYYPSKKPIEFKRPGNYVMNAPTIELRYLRSPQYPPGACKIVTFMLISKDGKEPQIVSSNQGYEASYFPTGMFYSFYMTGSVELKSNTKIFIYAQSLSNDPTSNEKGAIISNTLDIPVVYVKD